MRWLRKPVIEIGMDALQFTPHTKVDSTLRCWLSPRSIQALRRIRFRLLVIRDHDGSDVFRVEDLVTGEALSLFDDTIPPPGSWRSVHGTAGSDRHR